jgi:MFS transporter, UMF1 family
VTAASSESDDSLARAWCLYNWADHAWVTPVAAALIGPWMLSLAKRAVGSRGVVVGVGPLVLRGDAFPSAMVAVAAVVQLLVLPAVGAHVDARSTKRRWLAGACVAGAVACLALGLTSGSAWIAAGTLFVLGSLAEGVSDLAWQGMLPEIAGPAERDGLSARGSSFGYLGGGVILAVNLALVELYGSLGLSKEAAVRLCFVSCGVWWLSFGLPSLRHLKPQRRGLAAAPTRTWRRLRHDLRLLSGMPNTGRYMLAYLCFGDAVSAVISLSAIFLTHELFHDSTTKATPFLLGLILVIQFVALGGALLGGRLAARIGAKLALVATLAVWLAVIVYAWAGVHDKTQAVLAGVVIGVGVGITTPLARSLFSQMVPAGHEAAFFSLYEICNQGTAFIAPLLFTVVVDLTGSFRQAILSLVVLFAVGLFLLVGTDVDAAATEAYARPRQLASYG